MQANNENQNSNSYPLRISIIQREKTKKTSPDTETLSPSGTPDSNVNSVSHKLEEHEHDMQYIDFKKIKTFKISNNSKSMSRMDAFGNPILKKGKQKISFVDKITQNNFVEVIKIESFKAYNKMEEISNYNNMQNNCCCLI